MRRSPPIFFLLPLAGLIACACAAPAQDDRAAKVLEKFFDLGLPDAKGGKWVRIFSMDMQDGGALPGAGRVEYSGNAWLLREERGVIHAVSADGRVIRGKKMNGDDPTPGGDGGLPPIQIQPANLDADLKVFSEALKPKGALQLGGNENEQAKARNAGGALLFLAQLQRQGRADFVREMLPQVLASMPSPELALDGAVSLLADGQLAVLAHQWGEKGDAVAYAAAVGNLAATFPRGWGNREAAALLAAKLRSQTPSPLATENDARSAAALLLKLKPAEFQQLPAGQNWFIQGSRRGRSFEEFADVPMSGESDEDQPPGKPAKKNAEVAAFFKNKRAAAIALAELLDDHRYLRLVAREDGNNFNSRRYSSGGHQSHEAVLRAQYDQLSRPSELGEFAWTLLARLVPEEVRDAAGERPEARAETTLAWLKSVAGKSDEELAWDYLRNSQATYQDEFRGSLAFLVEKGGPETLAALREVFLDPGVWGGGSMDEVLAEVGKYMKRAPADPAFAEKLRAAVKSGLDADEANNRRYSQNESNTDRQLAARRAMQMKKLDQLFTPPQSVTDQLAEIIAMEEPEALASFTVAAQSLATKPLKEIEPAIFQAAAKAKPVMLKSQMLQLLLTTAMRGARGQAATGAVAPPAVPGEPATREAIQILLRDETPVPNEYDPANAFSISDMTSWVVLALHDQPARQGEWQRIGMAFPHLAKIWSRAYARAIANGQPVPPMPSAANLAAGRAGALVAELGALPAAQIPAALDTKTPDEQLAVVEHLAKATDWPAAITEAHFTVRKVVGEQAANLGGAAWKGRRMDEKFAHEIQTAIEDSAAAGKFFAVLISGGEPLAGVRISVIESGRTITEQLFSSYELSGLAGRPVPAAFVEASIQGVWGQEMRGAVDSVGIVIWKDAAVTRAWREETGKRVEDQAKNEKSVRGHSTNPAPFEQRMRACLSLQKDARGPFRMRFSANGIGSPSVTSDVIPGL